MPVSQERDGESPDSVSPGRDGKKPPLRPFLLRYKINSKVQSNGEDEDLNLTVWCLDG